jgi:leucyl-tRNA---protein transferase
VTPYFDSIRPETLSGSFLDQLLALGWYRMHQALFTCSHVELDNLYRVYWLRYSLRELRDRPEHRRIRNRASNFRYAIKSFTEIPSAHKELHTRYRASIDFDGALSIEECLFGDEDSGRNIYTTKCVSIFDGNKLIAGGYFDVGETASASILHFFDPNYSRYSLGKYLILLTVDHLKQNGHIFYYPGYVIEGLAKMNYKLFLGKNEAQYFDPEEGTWKYFQNHILTGQPSNMEQSPFNNASEP